MTTTHRNSIRRRIGALLLAACYTAQGGALAAPALPQVAAGQASFSQQGNVFSITNTPGTIINWQSFNIGTGEITRFIQQSSDSAVLNRVLGQDPSKILGALQSNGKVFLINPNGIVFGQGSRVDVNGLVASTLNLSDADFLAGKKKFQAGPTAGSVRNEGAITTPRGGQVFLIAPDVENKGIINAPNGDVILAAGHSVQLVDSSDPDLQVVLSAPDHQAVNLGQVVAQGGRIGIYGALVNQRGLVSADSAVRGENGNIVLKSSRATLLDKGSVTSAAGSQGADGGEIRLLGPQVGLEGNASVDAGGAAGGTVLVGGGWQGGEGIQRARQTSFGANATIRADGSAGNGGKVVLWSDGATSAHGSISVRGNGGGTGNGGQVETSGHDLDIAGLKVDARGGAKGKNGTWLLDPYDIEVVAGGTAGVKDVAPSTSGSTSGVTKVAPSTLTASGADVVLQAQHDLTVTDAIAAVGSVRAQAGNDIRVNAAVSSSGGDLDFRAANAFVLGANGTLKSNDYIDIRANQMTLAGNVGGAGTQLPVLTLASSDPNRYINVGAGTPDPAALWLQASDLARLSGGVYEINLGNSQQTGAIAIVGALSAKSHLVLESAGKITVSAPVDLSANPDSRFIASLYGGSGGLIQIGAPLKAGKSVLLQGDRLWIDNTISVANGGVSLMPNTPATPMTIGGAGSETGFSIGQDALANIKAAELTIGGMPGASGGLAVIGAATLTGTGGPAKVTLDAGSGELGIKAPLAASGTVSLKSSAGIYESAEGSVSAAAAALRGGQVVLTGANHIGTLAGSSTSNLFHVANADKLRIGSADGLTGVDATGASLLFNVGGALVLDAEVRGGSMAMLDAAGITGSAPLKAATVSLRSSAGIGSTTNSFKTEASALMAYNQGTGEGTSNKPINISNQGALTVISAVQDGEGNAGGIAIDSIGGMTVPAYAPGSASAASGEVRTGSGDINLVTHSPLNIQGRVTTTSGNVRLQADNGGKVTIGGGARVASGSGEVRIDGGSTDIADGAISVASPDKLHVSVTGTGGEQPPPPPTLESCIATPTGAGCGDVLAAAVQACVADSTLSYCAAVLPSLATCQADPTKAGCGVVLARNELDQCVANPQLPGCASKLPTYDTCVAKPATYGCAPVIKQHDQVTACIADPKAPGCATTLPAYEVCAANPSTYGCAPVIKQHDQVTACIADPKAPGCATTLPAYEVCTANPSTYGCAPVIKQHDQVTACIADPKAAGCAATLPTLAVCHADASVYGCVAVLARERFDACLADPAGPGCATVLPSLAQCKASPSLEGCTQVLALGFQACLVNPHDASCSGILPTLSQCVADSGRPGCDVVLPTLSQCIGSPGLQGCEVRLPKLAQCAVNPALPGCEAVLPKPDFCATHPTDPSCQVLTGNGGSGGVDEKTKPVAQAVQTTIQLINVSTTKVTQTAAGQQGGTDSQSGTPAGGGERVAGPEHAQQTGAINEKPATKNYCN